MHKKVLTEQSLYFGDVTMPKNWEIDQNDLAHYILQSNLTGDRFKFSRTWDKLNTYISEFINVEYVQNWSNGIEVTKKNSKKIFTWKLDKKIVGSSAVLNEIGTHAYHLANYISGLKGSSLFADIKKFNKKINLDNNAQVILNYENGAKGIFWTCISAKGGNYGLRIRIFGSKGSLEWVQNDPNYLRLNPAKGAVKILEKGFHEADFSKNFARVKSGHPEGYVDAFANIYNEVADHINSKDNKKIRYYPTAYEGLLTAKFIQTCIDSSRKKKWLKF